MRDDEVTFKSREVPLTYDEDGNTSPDKFQIAPIANVQVPPTRFDNK